MLKNDQVDFEMYRTGAWYMYRAGTPKCIASGHSRWRLVRLFQMTWAMWRAKP